jgi:NADH dehydrogenase/NADH:ubiquinone oxidoreductase subunit G
MPEIFVYVNDFPIKVSSKITLIEACDSAGFEIPRFCYHSLLNIAGNCRICLVEIEKSPKPQASCALPVAPNIRVYTSTPLVRKAQEGVIEFLLINHPLDCPICDQGGECDLQNQAIVLGTQNSRYFFEKRSFQDKNLGPLVLSIISRCIHCTRCIRFLSEVGGIEELGTSLRGQMIEVGTYIDKPISSEVSGNLVDLCPVGSFGFQAF